MSDAIREAIENLKWIQESARIGGRQGSWTKAQEAIEALQALQSGEPVGLKLSPEVEQEKLDNNRYGVTVPEWNGEGLPPVGVVCEFVIGERIRSDAHRHWEDGDKLEVLAHRNGCAIVYNKTAGAAAVVNTNCTRPIKSEREKAIKAMRLIVDEYAEKNNALGALFDAGYRKVEK
jgi:hypothetical protein